MKGRNQRNYKCNTFDLGGSYSRASNGIFLQETETFPTYKKILSGSLIIPIFFKKITTVRSFGISVNYFL